MDFNLVTVEKQLIADILMNEKSHDYIFAKVEPDDFKEGLLKTVYEKAQNRYRQGNGIDPVTVLYDLPPTSIAQAKKILYEIAQETLEFTLDNYKEHTQAILKQSYSWRLSDYANELSDLAIYNAGVEDIQEKLNEGLKRFDSRHEYKAASYLDGYRQFIESLDKPEQYFKTGYPKLDECLKISAGDYIIIGARPSVGKTAFALELAYRMASQEDMFTKVVFFSFETSTKKIFNRIISNKECIDFNHIVNGTVTALERQMVQEKIDDPDTIALDVVEASGMNVVDIQAEALKRKADVIFIDYIGLIAGNETQQVSSYERMTQISKDLHTFAQKRKITVIGLSQLNREAGQKEAPTLANLRDSGQVEQDADAVLLLSRKTGITDDEGKPINEEYRLCEIAKNKEGKTDKLCYMFIGEHQRFVES